MRVEIITVGNELTAGEIVDTNAAFLARELNGRGFEVSFITTTGDDEWRIGDALLRAQERSEGILVSGGLGPTADDVTACAAAKALGRRLIMNEEVLRDLRERFRQRGMEMPLSNEKQALFPQQAEILPNARGTAPGFVLRHRGKTFAFLPGAPGELKPLFQEKVLPLLEEEWPEKTICRSRTLKVFGLTEPEIADRLREVEPQRYGAALAYLPRFPENHVKITVRASQAEEVEKGLEELEAVVREKLSGRVFALDPETMEEIVGRLLREHRATLAVAESCTGGRVADRLTDVPGSSEYFERGVVAYSNRAKEEILQVPAELLAAAGAVSAAVAEKMAEGVRRISRTTLGLALTGIAGPGGGSAEKPVGTVYIALSGPGGSTSKGYRFWGNRGQIKAISAQTALDWVRRYFLHLPPFASGFPVREI
ncbi:MAG: competence/damage-inducible protein A [Deltaproteobacteria bacterium]|nr:competence/damage-inducible protein A [Deltaproteobacteria bacterium]